MAGVINTGSHPKLLWPGIRAIWGQLYDNYSPQWERLVDVYSSQKNYEEDIQIVDFGLAPQKPEGAATTYDSEVQGFLTRYTHIAYSLGYIVTKEEMDDNLYAQVSANRVRSLFQSFMQTKENVVANLYNRAFTGGIYAIGDGVSLLNSAHPLTGGGTLSNVLSTSANLSEAAIEDLIIQIMGATNDRGLLIGLQPESIHVPRQLFYDLNRILKTMYQTGNGNNDVNVVAQLGTFPKGGHVNQYFTSQTAWFIRTNAPEGLKFYERHPLVFDQDNDFDTMNAKAKGYERYSVGATDPRGLYGSAGA